MLSAVARPGRSPMKEQTILAFKSSEIRSWAATLPNFTKIGVPVLIPFSFSPSITMGRIFGAFASMEEDESPSLTMIWTSMS